MRIDLTGQTEVHATFKSLLPKIQKNALARLAAAVHDDVKDRIGLHTDKGALEQSLRWIKRDDEHVIYNDLQRAEHALFVHWGTKPHVIRARTKQALKFVGKDGKNVMFFGPKTPQQKAMILKWRDKKALGTRIFFKWPMHPGYSGDPYFVHAAAKAPSLFASIIREMSNDKSIS